MAENNRNQFNRTDQRDQQVEQERKQPGQPENTGSQNTTDENPQRGSEWSNYQTRELSSDQNSSSAEELSNE